MMMNIIILMNMMVMIILIVMMLMMTDYEDDFYNIESEGWQMIKINRRLLCKAPILEVD